MRTIREAVVILATVVLAGFAGHGLALAAADVGGGLDGWGALVAVVLAGLVTLVALVSSTLAVLVTRRRAWRIGYLVVTALGAVWVASEWLRTGSLSSVLAALALFTAFALAAWLPIGARWWLGRWEPQAEHDDAPVSGRAALTAGGLCGAVVIIVAVLTVSIAGSSVPSSLFGLWLTLLVTAAAASGRVPDTVALALLAGVGLCALLFGLPSLPDGDLVTGALALTVLVAFSWRPFAARLTTARRAAFPPTPPALEAPGD